MMKAFHLGRLAGGTLVSLKSTPIHLFTWQEHKGNFLDEVNILGGWDSFLGKEKRETYD